MAPDENILQWCRNDGLKCVPLRRLPARLPARPVVPRFLVDDQIRRPRRPDHFSFRRILVSLTIADPDGR